MIKVRRWASYALVATMAAGGVHLVEGMREANAAPAPQKRAMVFALATGVEDTQEMASVFRHARVAAEQKKLGDVVVLVYGRGVQALDANLAARPPAVTKSVEEALAAGVKVQVCEHALQQFGIAKDKLVPTGVTTVPNAMAAMVDYVAAGAEVVRY